MRNIITTAAALAAIIAAPSAALASPANMTAFNETVSHSDLNLATEEGAERLQARVETRVRQLCRTGARDSVSRQLERDCREAAFAQALPQVRLAIAEARSSAIRLAQTSEAEGTDTPGA